MCLYSCFESFFVFETARVSIDDGSIITTHSSTTVKMNNESPKQRTVRTMLQFVRSNPFLAKSWNALGHDVIELIRTEVDDIPEDTDDDGVRALIRRVLENQVVSDVIANASPETVSTITVNNSLRSFDERNRSATDQNADNDYVMN
jgi:hypothetical protein